jgi:hypothetical protein
MSNRNLCRVSDFAVRSRKRIFCRAYMRNGDGRDALSHENAAEGRDRNGAKRARISASIYYPMALRLFGQNSASIFAVHPATFRWSPNNASNHPRDPAPYSSQPNHLGPARPQL